MTTSPAAPRWTPLTALAGRFDANLFALAGTRPALAGRLRALAPSVPYAVGVAGETIHLGTVSPDGTVTPLPCSVPPARVGPTVRAVFPDAVCTSPVLVVGESLGWLWDRLYRLPCNADGLPGHRPPLYFMIGDLERLWAILHLHDWRDLLADPRVHWSAGPDAAAQLGRTMRDEWACVWPRKWVTVDPTLWPAGVSFDTLRGEAALARSAALVAARAYATPADAAAVAARHAAGRPLRVLGITSRYTAFLRHSTRDWLAGFARLGHTTRLLEEGSDHQTSNPLVEAAACADFRPDLVVVIDHHRAELPGLPPHVPVAMWVQDHMPDVYSAAAGRAQGPLDYTLGFAYEQLQLTHTFGYPASRFLPTLIGMDEEKFAPRPLSPADRDRYGCDASFVTNASVPAERMVQDMAASQSTPQGRRLLAVAFDRLRAVYDAGRSVVAPPAVRRIVVDAFAEARADPTPDNVASVTAFFYHRVNNALFRHQTVRWLAATGCDLRLYGQGWDANPEFARYARGVAAHGDELATIYRASRINLHASPFGCLHQRVFEGLGCGGFFLLRHFAGDRLERHYAALWDWCQRSGTTTDDGLRTATDPDVRRLLAAVADVHAADPFGDPYGFLDVLRASHDSGYQRSAGCVWGDDYDAVSFDAAAELQQKVTHYLAHPDDRRRVSASMLRPVMERFTYTRTADRLLRMIARDSATDAALAA